MAGTVAQNCLQIVGCVYYENFFFAFAFRFSLLQSEILGKEFSQVNAERKTEKERASLEHYVLIKIVLYTLCSCTLCTQLSQLAIVAIYVKFMAIYGKWNAAAVLFVHSNLRIQLKVNFRSDSLFIQSILSACSECKHQHRERERRGTRQGRCPLAVIE